MTGVQTCALPISGLRVRLHRSLLLLGFKVDEGLGSRSYWVQPYSQVLPNPATIRGKLAPAHHGELSNMSATRMEKCREQGNQWGESRLIEKESAKLHAGTKAAPAHTRALHHFAYPNRRWLPLRATMTKSYGR